LPARPDAIVNGFERPEQLAAPPYVRAPDQCAADPVRVGHPSSGRAPQPAGHLINRPRRRGQISTVSLMPAASGPQQGLDGAGCHAAAEGPPPPDHPAPHRDLNRRHASTITAAVSGHTTALSA
jgi:hypothetical protein